MKKIWIVLLFVLGVVGYGYVCFTYFYTTYEEVCEEVIYLPVVPDIITTHWVSPPKGAIIVSGLPYEEDKKVLEYHIFYGKMLIEVLGISPDRSRWTYWMEIHKIFGFPKVRIKDNSIILTTQGYIWGVKVGDRIITKNIVTVPN